MYTKKKWGNEIVKATVSYGNGSYVIERTVYVNENGIEYIKVNGCFVKLSFYKTNPNYKFHGYYSVA